MAKMTEKERGNMFRDVFAVAYTDSLEDADEQHPGEEYSPAELDDADQQATVAGLRAVGRESRRRAFLEAAERDFEPPSEASKEQWLGFKAGIHAYRVWLRQMADEEGE